MTRAQTKIYGIIGNPAMQTLSPVMHNAAFQKLGIDAQYVEFPTRQLKATIEKIRNDGICGVSVTVPHKETVLKYLDVIDDTAARIGAVNTVLNKNGILHGINTDFIGAVQALEQVTSIEGKTIGIIGAGGAARAIAYGVKNKGARVIILNRTLEKAITLVKDLFLDGAVSLSDTSQLRFADIIVNATTVGSGEVGDTPMPLDVITKHHTVFDVLYIPMETALLKHARRVGANIVYGYRMLLYQAVIQFEKFTGVAPPLETMEKALIQSLK
jgi:shikimate dehydrogenase